MVLSLLGGLIGIMLYSSLAFTGARVLSVAIILDPFIILFAFAFSAAVRVVFDYSPARHAARLDPIEALRHQ